MERSAAGGRAIGRRARCCCFFVTRNCNNDTILSGSSVSRRRGIRGAEIHGSRAWWITKQTKIYDGSLAR